MKKKFVRLDCDQVGDKIELFLYQNRAKDAQSLSDAIKQNITVLANSITEKFHAKILLIGADDILFEVSQAQFDIETFENLKLVFLNATGISLSAGIGNDIFEALQNLKIAKISGRNKVVGS